MKILGKSVSRQFQSFYRDIEPNLALPVKFERGPFEAMGDICVDAGKFRCRLDTSLTRPDFEAIAAHELLHAVQLSELWPSTAKAEGLTDESPEAIVGEELQALILDRWAEETLKKLGLGTGHSEDTRYRNSKRGLETGSIAVLGSPWYHLWVIRYAHLALEQSGRRWKRLKELYWNRSPAIAAKGEEMLEIVKKHGWSNPDQALASMLAVRDSLGLPKGVVIIVDNKTGEKF